MSLTQFRESCKSAKGAVNMLWLDLWYPLVHDQALSWEEVMQMSERFARVILEADGACVVRFKPFCLRLITDVWDWKYWKCEQYVSTLPPVNSDTPYLMYNHEYYFVFRRIDASMKVVTDGRNSHLSSSASIVDYMQPEVLYEPFSQTFKSNPYGQYFSEPDKEQAYS